MARKVIYFKPNATGGIGDALMALPALERIKTLYPDSAIYCKHNYRRIFKHQPLFEGFVDRAEDILKTPPTGYKQIFNKLEGPECIIYPDCWPPLAESAPHAINFICCQLGLDEVAEKINFKMAKADIDWAGEVARQLGRKFFILHQPCPVTRCKCSLRKSWYNERWVEVVRWLKGRGYAVIQLGVVFEQSVAGAVKFMGRTSIQQALALFRFAHGFIGVDSVFNHATSIASLPGVVLFGATTPRIWGYKHNVNIYKGLECQPCFDRRRLMEGDCPERNCMKSISVDEVIQHLTEIIH